MGLLQRCEELFSSADLYQVLGVTREASKAEIRRGYYKVSLLVHPDRAPDDQMATEKFQTLGQVYTVLSDQEKRALYDEQGTVDEEADALSQERCWDEYWRLLFPKITLADILQFEKTYKHSAEEQADVLQLYTQAEGDMDHIMTSLLCAGPEDEPRVRDIIQSAIDAGEVPAHRAFVQESDRKKKARKRVADKERKEAEKVQKEMGLQDGEDSLVAMLQKRQKSREQGFNSFLANLEEKYSKKGGKGGAAKKGKK